MIKNVGKDINGIQLLNVVFQLVTNAQITQNGMVKHVNVMLDTML